MRILETSVAEAPAAILAVVAATVVAPYTLQLTFADDEQRTVDFSAFLLRATHPAIRAYLNETRFRQFDIINGNVNWNDYDLIFPIADLYAGAIG